MTDKTEKPAKTSSGRLCGASRSNGRSHYVLFAHAARCVSAFAESGRPGARPYGRPAPLRNEGAIDAA